jgi:hypothetical protein
LTQKPTPVFKHTIRSDPARRQRGFINVSEVIFYERPVPLNRESHKDLRLKPMPNLQFSAKAHSVPLACVEFASAAHDVPVLFAGNSVDDATPVALTGVRQDENLMVDAQGHWADSKYVPAFVRRYPFILAEKPAGEEGNDFAVFLDEASEAFSQDDGERLFNEDGSDSEVMKNVVNFLTDYQSQINRTRQFMSRLRALDLLVGRNIEIKLPGNNIVLNGLFVVDEEKLLKLDAETVHGMLQDGTLAFVHAHLFSLPCLDFLIHRLRMRMTPEELAQMEKTEKPEL